MNEQIKIISIDFAKWIVKSGYQIAPDKLVTWYKEGNPKGYSTEQLFEKFTKSFKPES